MNLTELLKKIGIDWSAFRLAYQLGREQGRRFLKGALILPGIRISDLEAIAVKQGEPAAGLIAKRDAMLNAIIDFVEALADLDDE